MQRIARRSLLATPLALPLALPRIARAEGQDASAPENPGRTPHTRFAVNVEMWWRELDFLQRIAMASELGFPAIEFWPWRGKDVGAIADLSADLGIEVAQFTAWGFEPGMNDARNHTRLEREIKEACEVARRLGCKKMTVLGGNDQPGMSRETMLANIVQGLKIVAPVAENAGVMLILEPLNTRVDHAGHCLYGSEDALRICREVGSTHVKINWDLYHMQITEGDLCGRLRAGYEQVGYVQLADHPGRNEPGTGEIHYPRVLRELHELGYRGFVGLECWPKEGELAAARRVNEADRW